MVSMMTRIFWFIALYRGVSGQSNHGVGWVAPLKKPDAEDAEMGWRRRQLRAIFDRGWTGIDKVLLFIPVHPRHPRPKDVSAGGSR